MKLHASTTVTLRNLATGQTAPFYIGYLAEYRGQYIVYGETKSHLVGEVLVLRRPGLYVVLPNETAENILAFVLALGGSPWVVVERVTSLFVVNWASRPQGQDAALKQAAEVIDLYFHWKEKGDGLALHEWRRKAKLE